MTLAAGTRLGPYEVLAPLGAGGMGEVWRARDTRLARDVAIKVLPDHFANDPKALRRFESEAKAVAALSDPNILSIFDVGETNGIHYAVTELLEGATLRALVARGPVPVKRTLEIACQVAEGLAAAHEKGIVHRDVKPENVFLTKDGHVKILDFGLARHETTFRDPNDTHSPTLSEFTEAGTVVGTVAYMSPEQASGKPVDHRSDQFSLGTVLYEMLARKRPFGGATTAETLTAIIREEPEPLSRTAPSVPASVRWIVERCLAKVPAERYDSTRDLARELSSNRTHLSEATSGSAPSASAAPVVRRLGRPVLLGVLAAAVVGATLAAGLALERRAATRSQPKFERLTFKRGTITGARFAPDGRTVVYSAAWDGAPAAVYSLRLDALDPVPSGYTGANLLAVSAKSQLALSLEGGISNPWLPAGTLAISPFAGGTPRELDSDVGFADFSSDGEKLVITRGTLAGHAPSLEYPSGTVLYRSAGVYLSHVRISPSGDHLAFLEHMRSGDSGDVVVVDRSGKAVLRKGPFNTLEGLAWSPRGDEVWFGGDPVGNRVDLRAVTLGGRERVVLAAPVPIVPHDVAPDGRVLASTVEFRSRLFYRGEPGSPERELSTQGNSNFGPISRDGSWVAFVDDSLKGVVHAYLRSTSGAPPVSLGPGWPQAFAPDGRTLVVVQPAVPSVILQPVGPGQPTTIRLDGFQIEPHNLHRAGLFPDGKAIWFTGRQPPGRPRVWQVAVSGGMPRPLTPEGVDGWVTDDGASVVFPRDGRQWIQPLEGGEARPVEGVLDGEAVAAWTAGGKPLFVYRNGECPARTFRLDPKTGKREFFREVGPADATGVLGIYLLMTPNGNSCAYAVAQWLSELHLIEALR